MYPAMRDVEEVLKAGGTIEIEAHAFPVEVLKHLARVAYVHDGQLRLRRLCYPDMFVALEIVREGRGRVTSLPLERGGAGAA